MRQLFRQEEQQEQSWKKHIPSSTEPKKIQVDVPATSEISATDFHNACQVLQKEMKQPGRSEGASFTMMLLFGALIVGKVGKPLPPKNGRFLLYCILPREQRNEVLDNLEEEYEELFYEFGPSYANFFYWTQVWKSMAPLCGRRLEKVVDFVVGYCTRQISGGS